MYQPPSGKQMSRRGSMACSSPQPHGARDTVCVGSGSPSAVRKRPQQPTPAEDESQEQGAINPKDNTSTDHAANMSTSAFQGINPQDPTLTDQLITQHIHNYIVNHFGASGVDMSRCFEQAAMYPPITLESLAELDLGRIINNPRLRHDVNFDRELHFRPNFDGSKGKMKQHAADGYWKALEGELFMFGVVAQGKASAMTAADQSLWHRAMLQSQKRMRIVLKVVRDILKTLVPETEISTICSRLDVDLIMQEITNGVCDLVDLAKWLAKMLQAHCAPMRDKMVEEMRVLISDGAMDADQGKIVCGLRQLLGVLEAMKLDVANHQIRHMRVLLVDDTVNFQRRYNAHRIGQGKVDIVKARNWLDDEMVHLNTDGYVPTPLVALTAALLKDILFSETTIYPPTFSLDSERIRNLRHELHIRIYLLVVRDVVKDLTPASVGAAALVKGQQTVRDSVTALVGSHGKFAERLENIAAEIVRIILAMEGRDELCDSMLLGIVEQRLQRDMHCASPVFDRHAQQLCELILPRLVGSVEDHARLSALDLQEAFVPAMNTTSRSSTTGFGVSYVPPGQTKPTWDEDVIRRLTHIICLHWQIWADLAYFVPDNEDDGDTVMTDSGQEPTPPPSAASSPTIPVAKAIYGPGKTWLPIGIIVTEVPMPPTPAATPAPSASDEEETLPEQPSLERHE